MMLYTLIDSATGQVLARGQTDSLEGLGGPGMDVIPAYAPDPEHCWWDGQQFQLMPQRPGPSMRWDWATKTWSDPRTLEQRREARWEALKAERQQRIDAGFTWNGYVFDSDEQSRGNISGASTAAIAGLSANLPFSVTWTLQDNSTVQLDAQQMIAVGLALMAHVDAQHATARSLRLQIDAAQTPEEVDAVTWAEDDPSNASTAA